MIRDFPVLEWITIEELAERRGLAISTIKKYIKTEGYATKKNPDDKKEILVFSVSSERLIDRIKDNYRKIKMTVDAKSVDSGATERNIKRIDEIKECIDTLSDIYNIKITFTYEQLNTLKSFSNYI